MTKTMNVTLSQSPAEFKDGQTGKVIEYFEYTIKTSMGVVKLKPINGEQKAYLQIAFSNIKEGG